MKETYHYDLSNWESFFKKRMKQVEDQKQLKLKESMAMTNEPQNKIDIEILEENMLMDFEADLLTSFEIKEFPNRGEKPLDQNIQQMAGILIWFRIWLFIR